MQQLVVALVVLAALAYVIWTFMPLRWRQRLSGRLGLGTRLVKADGCHGCNDCDGCVPGAAPMASPELNSSRFKR